MAQTQLTPTQEHYLKRELLKLEIEQEFSQFNDGLALRRFGYPFINDDPTKLSKDKLKRISGEIDTLPLPVPLDNDELDDFPLTKHFFKSFLLTIPFLSQDHQDYDEFWVRKVQVFYEKFMGMSMSESLDREELTKRKKMGKKISKLFLMIYNSGIGTTHELQYYTTDKKIEVGDSTHQSNRLEKLLFPSKDNLRDYISKGKFVNGLNVNVVGVRLVKKANSKNFWNNISQIGKSEYYYEFLIKTKIDLPESENVYVARRYREFRDLHHQLKQRFPGKHLPSLPSKVKADISLGQSSEIDPDDEDEDEDNEETEKDNELERQMNNIMNSLKINIPNVFPKTPDLGKVKSSDSEDSSTSSFAASKSPPRSPRSPKSPSFLKSPKLPWNLDSVTRKANKSTSTSTSSSSTLAEPVSTKPTVNIASNVPREKTRVSLRAYLRELLDDVEISHSECFKEFLYKGKILKLSDEEQRDIQSRENLDLILLMNQVKFQSESFTKITQLKKSSLPLREKVLQTDNGIIEIFSEFKEKEHIEDLSPMLRNFIDWCKVELAATIYQLFLGNDNSYEFYSQIKRIHKLMPYSLMINILKFTNPMSIMKAMIDLLMANPFGGKSLLQTLFYGILSDDMRSQSKVINVLEEKINNEQIITRLKYFVYECNDFNLRQIIREESKELSVDLILTVIISPHLSEVAPVDDETVGTVFESYNEFKKLKDCDPEDVIFINQEKTTYYSNLKELYRLYIKNHDKEILQQIWSQPDLTLILKDLFTMFYQPLVTLFKNARVDIAFKNFQKFMDDLIELIDRLSMEIYVNDASKIVEEIMQCINNHQDDFYQFLHQVYLNDKDKIFEKMIYWINSLMNFLRTGKAIESNSHRIDLNKVMREAKNVDDTELLEEVNEIIHSVKLKHEAFLKKQEAIRAKKEKDSDLLNNKWEQINSNLDNIFDTTDFGINDHDILEFNEDDDSEHGSIKTKTEEPVIDLKNEEIKKLLKGFKQELVKTLPN